MSSPKASIIIVNWNVKPLILRLLASVFRHTKAAQFELIVVDNASGDGSAEAIREKFPGVTLIANKDNKGFAAACNQGIKISRGEFILLLNPDTEVFDDSVSKIADWMSLHPDVGIAGGRVLNPDGSVQSDVRQFPGPFDQALILLKMHHIFPKAGVLRRYFAHDFDYAKEQEADQVIGAFFCIRKSIFPLPINKGEIRPRTGRKRGLFDESFFLWFEEVDLCKRAREAGWKIMYVPSVAIIHHGGASFAQVFALRKQRYYNGSLMVYAGKHWGPLWKLFFAALSPVSLCLAWIAGLLKIKPRAYKRII